MKKYVIRPKWQTAWAAWYSLSESYGYESIEKAEDSVPYSEAGKTSTSLDINILKNKVHTVLQVLLVEVDAY